MSTRREPFYVTIALKQGEAVAHAMSLDREKIGFGVQQEELFENEKSKEVEKASSDEFEDVFSDFVSWTNSYMHFMPIIINFTPYLAGLIAQNQIHKFVQQRGNKIDDLSDEKSEVYELNYSLIREFYQRHENTVQAGQGSRRLPEILVVGLISMYDAFLASLLRVVIKKQPETIFTSEKQFSYKELKEFESIDAMTSSIVDREIEAVIRKSHHDQFDWIQKTLSMKLRENLDVWPQFIELCERRNLFTHTGGVVSSQYIENCRKNGVKVSARTGEKLIADAKYYKTAVESVHEVGLKLCYVLWRKFAEDSADSADKMYNERCMELIRMREYSLAESLLRFGISVKPMKDQTKRMMIVNYANAIKLLDRRDEAIAILDEHDWSASNLQFQLCVEAVKGDVGAVIRIMDDKSHGLSATDFRNWPVFRGIRTDAVFQEKFKSVFGEPLLEIKPSLVSEADESKDAVDRELKLASK